MTVELLLLAILIGVIAGWLANVIFAPGKRLLPTIVIAVLGAVFGVWGLALMGYAESAFEVVVCGFMGSAVVLIATEMISLRLR